MSKIHYEIQLEVGTLTGDTLEQLLVKVYKHKLSLTGNTAIYAVTQHKHSDVYAETIPTDNRIRFQNYYIPYMQMYSEIRMNIKVFTAYALAGDESGARAVWNDIRWNIQYLGELTTELKTLFTLWGLVIDE